MSDPLMMLVGACGLGLGVLLVVLVLLVRAAIAERRRNRASHDWIQRWSRKTDHRYREWP